VSSRQPVAVVTGGGGGIGAAIAMEMGRQGWHVVTVDPMVTVDGAAPTTTAPPEDTTAGRIVAAGGSAQASAASVTDGPALKTLFEQLVSERGGLDAVVNVGGISRPTGFTHGTEDDWRAVISVHLDGYLTVLGAALPIMAAAGRGHILGVTSGSGWRAADAGAYSCAKRAVASLTWQLGRAAPDGVRINAISPIAVTRMVTSALERAGMLKSSTDGASGAGLSLLSGMPAPEEIGPIGAYLAGERFHWANGRIVFCGGSEVALVEEPRLLEVVRISGGAPVAAVLDSVIPNALVPAEAAQATSGGGNPRFLGLFDREPAPPIQAGPRQSVALVSDRPELAEAILSALGARSIACHRLDPRGGFQHAVQALSTGPDADAVIVALSGGTAGSPAPGWARILAEHAGVVDQIHTDGGWARATSDYAAAADRPVKLVVLSDATTAGGRSRAQAAAQLSRIAASSSKGRVTAFAVGLEGAGDPAAVAAGELVGQILGNPEAAGLAGAELVVSQDWLGLRSHPRPIASITYGGPAVPDWLDSTLREIVS
jgi:NAD(P)-dependent dehydrogenase (short-subunit alcohol dehydrogenase family)